MTHIDKYCVSFNDSCTQTPVEQQNHNICSAVENIMTLIKIDSNINQVCVSVK